mmetsp:Transcript_39523/g.62493  ORF Transcript_39523/g.62493 Transcript_39523/m.62493 type:complete len:133 (-) Transcript_39523:69-467(-)|eukprot:CAMPEP_0201510790 /NCGR_PEP_ID=MMETSP0161_2-20130828/3352_1 /ASSEMBLY_ACC=CAM_ASM_000251 /TAXON_ID=180227 /ORGANISM="Neoparamoeba aestuarina, Strain SoJaBio B1-5/56/2" /LENGTH=132 /DNA_ID=CAMNT_0047906029 /DNA_START=55 /DNA_END=453 /DNA_ORIENTATION=+
MTDAEEKSGFPWAVRTGDLKGVKEAVEKEGADVNMVSQDTNKRTPMHWAADFGHTEVLKYLHSKGANCNVKDNFGITPLLAAVYESHEEAVKFLVSIGADTNVTGPDGMTAFEAAEKQSIKALLKPAAPPRR